MGGVIRNGVTEEALGFKLGGGAISLVWPRGLARKSALGRAGSSTEGRDLLSVVRDFALWLERQQREGRSKCSG